MKRFVSSSWIIGTVFALSGAALHRFYPVADAGNDFVRIAGLLLAGGGLLIIAIGVSTRIECEKQSTTKENEATKDND